MGAGRFVDRRGAHRGDPGMGQWDDPVTEYIVIALVISVLLAVAEIAYRPFYPKYPRVPHDPSGNKMLEP